MGVYAADGVVVVKKVPVKELSGFVHSDWRVKTHQVLARQDTPSERVTTHSKKS